jgi:hypothetical protein
VLARQTFGWASYVRGLDDSGEHPTRQGLRLQDGLAGIVSKRLTAPYRSGPSRDWLKAACLDVFCPSCGTSRTIDLRKVDRHPFASVATLVLGLRYSWCPESAPMPGILGLNALPPAAKAAAISPNGCPESEKAKGFTIGLLGGLIRAGLATATPGVVKAGDRTLGVVRLAITEKGRAMIVR